MHGSGEIKWAEIDASGLLSNKSCQISTANLNRCAASRKWHKIQIVIQYSITLQIHHVNNSHSIFCSAWAPKAIMVVRIQCIDLFFIDALLLWCDAIVKCTSDRRKTSVSMHAIVKLRGHASKKKLRLNGGKFLCCCYIPRDIDIIVWNRWSTARVSSCAKIITPISPARQRQKMYQNSSFRSDELIINSFT